MKPWFPYLTAPQRDKECLDGLLLTHCCCCLGTPTAAAVLKTRKMPRLKHYANGTTGAELVQRKRGRPQQQQQQEQEHRQEGPPAHKIWHSNSNVTFKRTEAHDPRWIEQSTGVALCPYSRCQKHVSRPVCCGIKGYARSSLFLDTLFKEGSDYHGLPFVVESDASQLLLLLLIVCLTSWFPLYTCAAACATNQTNHLTCSTLASSVDARVCYKAHSSSSGSVSVLPCICGGQHRPLAVWLSFAGSRSIYCCPGRDPACTTITRLP
jgi:hypothetical protein